MGFSDNDKDLLDKYLCGKLTDAEKVIFDKKFESSEAFAKEVLLQQSIVASLRAHNKKVNKSDLENIFKAVKEEKKKTPLKKDRSIQRYYWIAASIVLLSLLLINIYNSSSPNVLYKEFYEPFPADPSVRNGKVTELDRARELYQEKRYGEAIPLFNEYIKEHPQKDRANLFLGICYLETEQMDKALAAFEHATHSENEFVKENGEWYLALTYLKLKDIEALHKQLNLIIKNSDLYKEQAKILLEEVSDMDN